MKTGVFKCARSMPSGKLCGADAMMLDSRYIYRLEFGERGEPISQLHKVEYHLDCPNCGAYWEKTLLRGVQLAEVD